MTQSIIPRGTVVRTTQPNEALHNQWRREVLASRRWGVEGTILIYHDSHGLSYEVRYSDGAVGHHDPSEIEVV